MASQSAGSARALLRLGSRGVAAGADPAALNRELVALRSYRDTLHDTMKGLVAKAADKLGSGEEEELKQQLEEVAVYLRNERLDYPNAMGANSADTEALAAALQREAEAVAALEEAREKAARDAEAARVHAAAAARLAAEWKAGREAHDAELRTLRKSLAAAQQTAADGLRSESSIVAAAAEISGLERALIAEAANSLALVGSYEERLGAARRAASAANGAAATLEQEEWEAKLRKAEAVAERERRLSRLAMDERAAAEAAAVAVEAAAERRAGEVERARLELSWECDGLRRTVGEQRAEIDELRRQLSELLSSVPASAEPPQPQKASRFAQYMAERTEVLEHIGETDGAHLSGELPRHAGAGRPDGASLSHSAQGSNRSGSSMESARQQPKSRPTSTGGLLGPGGRPGDGTASRAAGDAMAAQLGGTKNPASRGAGAVVALPAAKQRGNMLLNPSSSSGGG